MTIPIAYGYDPTTNTPVTFDPTPNVAVIGSPLTGATVTFRAMAGHALGAGYTLSIIAPKAREYDDIARCAGTAARTLPLPNGGGGPATASDLADFVLTIRPGTPEQPHLVIFDSALPYLIPETDQERYPGIRGWMRHLAELMDDPNTAVVIRGQRMRRSEIAEEIMSRIGCVVTMGPMDSMQLRYGVEVFGFEVPEGYVHVDHPRGAGTLWAEGGPQETITRYAPIGTTLSAAALTSGCRAVGVSRKHLASALGVSYNTVRSWQLGRRTAPAAARVFLHQQRGYVEDAVERRVWEILTSVAALPVIEVDLAAVDVEQQQLIAGLVQARVPGVQIEAVRAGR